MRRLLITLAAALGVVVLTAGGPSPSVTRYDTNVNWSRSFSLSFGSALDTTVWAGGEVCMATFTRVSGDVSVQPVFDSTQVFVDPGWPMTNSKTVANPLAGQYRYQWKADTLTTASPIMNYCCGAARGVRVRALGVAGRMTIYWSGRCQ